MRFNKFNVIIIIANVRLVASVTASTIDSGLGEKWSQISPELKETHIRVRRSWLPLNHSAVVERRRRLMKTYKELMNDVQTLLSGKLPFVKSGVPTTTQEQIANPAVPPGLSETQLKKLLSASTVAENTGYFNKAVKKALTKKLNAGSLAAGALGMLWPGSLGPVVSALLAPIVSDYVASKHLNQSV